MTITKQQNGSESILALEGRLDTISAPELEAALNECPTDETTLVIDLAGLEYISSAGLRVLLSTHKRLQPKGKLIVRHANETVMDIFGMTGFTEVLNLEA